MILWHCWKTLIHMNELIFYVHILTFFLKPCAILIYLKNNNFDVIKQTILIIWTNKQTEYSVCFNAVKQMFFALITHTHKINITYILDIYLSVLSIRHKALSGANKWKARSNSSASLFLYLLKTMPLLRTKLCKAKFSR